MLKCIGIENGETGGCFLQDGEQAMLFISFIVIHILFGAPISSKQFRGFYCIFRVVQQSPLADFATSRGPLVGLVGSFRAKTQHTSA